MEHRQKSLIICLTPLQMLIAEKIIEINNDQIFDLLVIALYDNCKYRYYFDRLKSKVKNAQYFVYEPSSVMENLKNFLEFKKFYSKYFSSNKNYKNYYLASIDSRHCQYIISVSKFSNLYTFDDGTANIVSNSIYFIDNTSKIKKMLFNFIGINLDLKMMKNLSKKHYTIYQSINSRFMNSIFLNLFENFDKNKLKINEKSIKIYLGQPLEEIFKENTFLYKESIFKTLKDIKVEYYFPHPRESIFDYSHFDFISSEKIFEDYVLDLLENYNVEVYTLISSAALNVASLPGVSVNFIYNQNLLKSYGEIYNLGAQLNCNFIKINND